MKILSSLVLPGVSIGGIAAGLPGPIVALCIVVALAPRLLAGWTDHARMRRDNAFREKILAAVPGLPESERADVLCELTRALNASAPPPPDPAAPGQTPLS
ncbi:hypothetical protein ACIRP7_36295 [Streptomyces sp. NPDC102270]|uniref:hypothetical protein n=1 Tax=Streptomyces sp. NPDC102270 TaxID=3366150 RepID=UPI0037FEF543